MSGAFEVGQTLYLHRHIHGNQKGDPENLSPVTVSTVGRKWISLANGSRFLRDDPRMGLDGHGYSSTGRCYITAEEFHRERAFNKALAELERWFADRRWTGPGTLTLENLEAALVALGVREAAVK